MDMRIEHRKNGLVGGLFDLRQYHLADLYAATRIDHNHTKIADDPGRVVHEALVAWVRQLTRTVDHVHRSPLHPEPTERVEMADVARRVCAAVPDVAVVVDTDPAARSAIRQDADVILVLIEARSPLRPRRADPDAVNPQRGRRIDAQRLSSRMPASTIG